MHSWAIGILVLIAIVLIGVFAGALMHVAKPDGIKDPFSPFQFWSWDPAYGSSPLQDPEAPRSTLFRMMEGDRVQPPYSDIKGPLAHVQPLQVSAAMTAKPYWRSRAYAAPLWRAGPLAKYRWKYTPYYNYQGIYGPSLGYYGSYPYYATW
jgi:hypothetical protein